LGPAILAGRLDTLWIYFLAPPLGMLLAAEVYVRTAGLHRVFCAKLHHHTNARCIFNCHFDALADAPRGSHRQASAHKAIARTARSIHR
jgi:hypothetical protein